MGGPRRAPAGDDANQPPADFEVAGRAGCMLSDGKGRIGADCTNDTGYGDEPTVVHMPDAIQHGHEAVEHRIGLGATG